MNVSKGAAACAVALVLGAGCRREQPRPDPSVAAPLSSPSQGAAARGPLAAVPATSASAARVIAPHPVWLVHSEGKYLGAQLSDRPDEGWASGPPEPVMDDDRVAALRRPAEATKVPGALRVAAGQPVTVFDSEGKHCSARTGALALLRPLYSEDASALGAQFGKLSGAARRSGEARMGAKYWAKGLPERPALVVDLEPEGECTGIWAQPAGSPEPRLVPFEQATGALAAASLGAMKALPVFAAIEARYARERKADEPAKLADLPEYSEAALVARLPWGGLMIWAGASACRGYNRFTVNLEVFFTAEGEGAPLRLYGGARPSQERWVAAASDLDHDGFPDVVTQDGFALGGARGLGEFEQARGREVYTCPGAGAAAASYR